MSIYRSAVFDGSLVLLVVFMASDITEQEARRAGLRGQSDGSVGDQILFNHPWEAIQRSNRSGSPLSTCASKVSPQVGKAAQHFFCDEHRTKSAKTEKVSVRVEISVDASPNWLQRNERQPLEEKDPCGPLAS